MDSARRIACRQEYEHLIGTAFWAEFMDRIRKYRGDASSRCESDPIDRVAKAQGEVFAVDHILRFPKEITGVEAPVDSRR